MCYSWTRRKCCYGALGYDHHPSVKWYHLGVIVLTVVGEPHRGGGQPRGTRFEDCHWKLYRVRTMVQY
jgi:hypothetical protein